jgi:putative oxidoreductase
VHLPNGFFMNFSGQQAGEGFEYHMLVITLGLVCLIAGGGRVSVDRAIEDRRHAPLAA